MNFKVVYFTRSGTSAKVAEKIASKLSCPLIHITDTMNWKGLFGFIRAGMYSIQKKDIDIHIDGKIEETDELIVVTPLWAGGIAPSTASFLKTVQLDKVHLVVTSGGSSLADRKGYKSVSESITGAKNEDVIIAKLLNTVDQANWPLQDTFC